MKKAAHLLSLAIGFGTVTACSQQHDRNDLVVQAAYDQQNLNPTDNPDVREGIQRQQREYQARQEAAREAERARQEAAREAERERNFRIDRSGEPAKGYPPPKQ
jgi:hypothetical protein